MVLEASTLSPVESSSECGLITAFTKVNVKADFRDYVNRYLSNRGLQDKSDRPYIGNEDRLKLRQTQVGTPSDGLFSPKSNLIDINIPSNQPSFGITLAALTERENLDEPIPKIISNLVNYITKHGLKEPGIYRISASGAQVSKLRQTLDRGIISY